MMSQTYLQITTEMLKETQNELFTMTIIIFRLFLRELKRKVYMSKSNNIRENEMFSEILYMCLNLVRD